MVQENANVMRFRARARESGDRVTARQATFAAWLETAWQGDNPTGDLIGDLRLDDSLPDIGRREDLVEHLRRHRACREAMREVSAVWRRFSRWRGRHG